jgi:dienelactone hydrolase
VYREQQREESPAGDGGASIELIVYPGAHHAFNFRVLTFPRWPGRWLEYNEAAAQDAEAKMRAFLDVHLGGTSPDQPTAK